MIWFQKKKGGKKEKRRWYRPLSQSKNPLLKKKLKKCIFKQFLLHMPYIILKCNVMWCGEQTWLVVIIDLKDIFPHFNCYWTTAIPPISHQLSDIAVQGPSLWVSSSALGVHKCLPTALEPPMSMKMCHPIHPDSKASFDLLGSQPWMASSELELVISWG